MLSRTRVPASVPSSKPNLQPNPVPNEASSEVTWHALPVCQYIHIYSVLVVHLLLGALCTLSMIDPVPLHVCCVEC